MNPWFAVSTIAYYASITVIAYLGVTHFGNGGGWLIFLAFVSGGVSAMFNNNKKAEAS
jgi:hypothetical protein